MFPRETRGLNKHLVPVDRQEAVVPALTAEGEGGVGGALEATGAGGSSGSPRPCGGGVRGT